MEGAAVIDGIKYIGDGEFSVSLERLVSLLEAQIITLRTRGDAVGDALDKAFNAHNVASYTIAEGIVADLIDGASNE